MTIDIGNEPEVCLIGKNNITIIEASVDHSVHDIGELQSLSIASGLQIWGYSVLDIVSIFGLIMGFKCDSDFSLLISRWGGHKRI